MNRVCLDANIWVKILTEESDTPQAQDLDQKQAYDNAWDIAETNQLVHLYDALYLALSDGIEFWTADERLVNSVTKSNAIIKLLPR